VAGLGVAGAHVLPNAMGVDVLEAVELKSGQRQEGVFGGIAGLIQKLGTSFALFALGWALDLSGYVGGATTQTPQALLTIRSLVSLIPFGLLIIALLLGASFPITRQAHRAMVSELERRRAQRAS
jgi:Na+/melibiose symporter-like transporter